MALDLTKISPKGRERYLRVGRKYGSADTLKQANKTLKGLGLHAALLMDRGFGTEDAARLEAARDALIDAGVGRETKAGEKKTTSKTYLAAVAQAKSTRAQAQTVLTNTLLEIEDDGDEESARKVETTLSQVSVLPDDGEKLAGQLNILRNTLLDANVAATAKKRGGVATVAALDTAAEALRHAAEDREGGGTKLSTEQMDIIDGIIVAACRSAKNAARQAAKALSQPAIVADFALTHISVRRGGDDDEDDVVGEPDGSNTPTGSTSPEPV
jgi:hypothetical protein